MALASMKTQDFAFFQVQDTTPQVTSAHSDVASLVKTHFRTRCKRQLMPAVSIMPAWFGQCFLKTPEARASGGQRQVHSEVCDVQ